MLSIKGQAHTEDRSTNKFSDYFQHMFLYKIFYSDPEIIRGHGWVCLADPKYLGISLSGVLSCILDKFSPSHHKRSTYLMLWWCSAPNYGSGSCLCGFTSKSEKTT